MENPPKPTKNVDNSLKINPNSTFSARESASFLLIGESGSGKTMSVATIFLPANFTLKTPVHKFVYFGTNDQDIAMLQLALTATPDIQFEQHGRTELNLLDSFDENNAVIFADDCNKSDSGYLVRFADDRARKQQCALFAVFHAKTGHKAYGDLLASFTHVLYPDAAQKSFSLYGLEARLSQKQHDEYTARLRQVFAYRLPTTNEGTSEPNVIVTATDASLPTPWSTDVYPEAFVIISGNKWYSSRLGFPLIVFAPK
jgi:ABC-type dipeptide/oligopeptide/nickel transport system ATPase component